MERRRANRVKQRLTCELMIGDRRHPGIVLDISETGLFIQTSASPPPGERARLTLRRQDGFEVEVEASVARRYVIPRRLVSVARGGVGLRIDPASEDFREFLDSVTRKEQPQAASTASSESSQGGGYLVRVKQTSGPRSRTLRINAASEEEAKVAASAKLDEGWEILAVDPVAA